MIIYNENIKIDHKELIEYQRLLQEGKLRKLSLYEWTLIGKDEEIEKFKLYLHEFHPLKIAIQRLNKTIKDSPEDERNWYFYQEKINKLSTEIMLEICVDMLQKEGKESVTIIFADKLTKQIIKTKYPTFKADVKECKKNKRKIDISIKRFIYSVPRVLIGLARLFIFSNKKEKIDVIAVKTDLYRVYTNGFGDPIITPISQYLLKNDNKVLEISYPRRNNFSMKDLRWFFKDKGVISFESIYVIGRIKSFLNFNNKNNLKFISNVKVGMDYIYRISNTNALILYGEYSKGMKAMIAEAKKKNIITVAVQHGVIYEYHPGYTFPGGIYSALKHDVLLTHGKAYSNVLKENNYGKDVKIITLGHPSLSLVGMGRKQREITQNRTILITSQPISRHIIRKALTQNLPSKIYEYFNNYVTCIIKLHPKHEVNDGYYNSLVSDYPFKNTIVVNRDQDLFSLISKSDLNISFTSTCIQEALFMGVPSIEILDKPQVYSFSDDFGGMLNNHNQVVSCEFDKVLINAYDILTKEDKYENPNEIIIHQELFGDNPKFELIMNLIRFNLKEN